MLLIAQWTSQNPILIKKAPLGTLSAEDGQGSVKVHLFFNPDSTKA